MMIVLGGKSTEYGISRATNVRDGDEENSRYSDPETRRQGKERKGKENVDERKGKAQFLHLKRIPNSIATIDDSSDGTRDSISDVRQGCSPLRVWPTGHNSCIIRVVAHEDSVKNQFSSNQVSVTCIMTDYSPLQLIWFSYHYSTTLL